MKIKEGKKRLFPTLYLLPSLFLVICYQLYMFRTKTQFGRRLESPGNRMPSGPHHGHALNFTGSWSGLPIWIVQSGSNDVTNIRSS